MSLEAARHRPWQFQATVSSRNLLLRTIVAVGSEALLALGDQVGTEPLLRSESGEAFVPTGAYGTALRVLADGTLLLGGPPSSGGPQAVLQRSADAGSSTTIVSSLAPNVGLVLDLFEVRSGTCLASTNSGGIWRSADAGSSWILTQTISGAYHIDRFFLPRSGTVWGGTGYSNLSLVSRLDVWESVDDGVSWTPRHTVHSSGIWRTEGWHRLTDSECLLAQAGDLTTQRGVLRSAFTSPASIGWSVVLSQAAFAGVLTTAGGHLLCGFQEDTTLEGGSIYRSLDQGSSWSEESRLAKRGNVWVRAVGDGSVDAYVTRMSVGLRTDRYRNFAPEEVT
jgi:hypothetical protein